jgi:hypothetical protein
MSGVASIYVTRSVLMYLYAGNLFCIKVTVLIIWTYSGKVFCDFKSCGVWSPYVCRSGGVVLDLCSSWVSHLPPEVEYSKVIGHGMNAAEVIEDKIETDDTRCFMHKNSVIKVVNLHNCFSTVDQWHREGSLRY